MTFHAKITYDSQISVRSQIRWSYLKLQLSYCTLKIFNTAVLTLNFVTLNSERLISTRNTLDCDQSNYSSRTVFLNTPIEFGETGNSAIQSADLENPTLEPNMKWIGRPFAEIRPFKIIKMW